MLMILSCIQYVWCDLGKPTTRWNLTYYRFRDHIKAGFKPFPKLFLFILLFVCNKSYGCLKLANRYDFQKWNFEKNRFNWQSRPASGTTGTSFFIAFFHITYFSNHHRLGIIRKLTNSKCILWKPFWNWMIERWARSFKRADSVVQTLLFSAVFICDNAG